MTPSSPLSESSWSGVTPWVAPNFFASSSLSSLRSTATIVAAPAMRQPWMIEIPTPPHPKTTQVEPGVTLAVLMAAPQSERRRLAQAIEEYAMRFPTAFRDMRNGHPAQALRELFREVIDAVDAQPD